MSSKYWIKLYHEILDDHKMGMLSDHLYRRVIELFLLAGEFDGDGELPTVEAMAWRLRIDPDQLQNDLETLQDKKIVTLQDNTWIVTKFAERQAPISDAERMRRLRERKQKEQYYGDEPVTIPVTICNVDTDIDTDSYKIRLDEDSDPPKNGGNQDLFDACREVYENKKGLPVTDGQSFSLMIANFKKQGVTAEDYAAAIDAMDADERYRGTKPTSYEKWAVGYADKRKHPAKVNKNDPQSIADHNQQVIEQLAKEMTWSRKNQR